MKTSKILVVGVAVALIIAIFLLILFSYIHSAFRISAPSNVVYGKPYFNFSIYTSGVLSYNNSNYAVPFAVLNYLASNLTNASIRIAFYSRNPVENIYYVTSPGMCVGCFNDQDVISSLKYYLGRYSLLNGASFSVVNINNLNSIPPSSTVILPTGLLPVTLMPGSTYTSNTTLLTLLSKGDTIVYVGDNFSRSIGVGSIIFKTSQQSLNLLSRYNISWDAPSTYGSLFYFSNPTFDFPNTYYNVSYVHAMNGTIIAFSNQPDIGWKNADEMAHDIALALYGRFWIPQIAYGSYNLSSPSSGRIGVFALQRYLTFQNISMVNNTFPMVIVNASNPINYTIYAERFNVYARLNGSLSMPQLIAETQTVPIVVGMNINSNKKTLVIPHIDLYTENMSYVTSVPIGFFNTTTGINVIKYESFGLPAGYYIAILRDFNNRPYAAALFQLAGIEVNPVELDFKNDTFVFALSSLGMPIANSPYSISLDNSYQTNGTTNNSEIFYTLPKGSIVGYGTHVFRIHIFSSEYNYTYSYEQKIFHIPVYYIEFAVVIAVVIVLNLVLKAPNRDEYYIDVPDFPPSKKTRIVVKKDDILSLFEKINAHYHWKYMPLLPEEIKNGITANIRYNNMPISITLQNAISILTKLVNSGDLVNIKDYYAPKKWIEESGYSIEYLATFRRLRDHCVTSGFLFTDLGASDEADMIVTKSGISAHIFIYAESGKRSKVRIDVGSKKYIVFFDEERRLKFLEKLHASFGEESEILKVAVSNGLVRVIDTEHLDQLII